MYLQFHSVKEASKNRTWHLGCGFCSVLGKTWVLVGFVLAGFMLFPISIMYIVINISVCLSVCLSIYLSILTLRSLVRCSLVDTECRWLSRRVPVHMSDWTWQQSNISEVYKPRIGNATYKKRHLLPAPVIGADADMKFKHKVRCKVPEIFLRIQNSRIYTVKFKNRVPQYLCYAPTNTGV